MPKPNALDQLVQLAQLARSSNPSMGSAPPHWVHVASGSGAHLYAWQQGAGHVRYALLVGPRLEDVRGIPPLHEPPGQWALLGAWHALAEAPGAWSLGLDLLNQPYWLVPVHQVELCDKTPNTPFIFGRKTYGTNAEAEAALATGDIKTISPFYHTSPTRTQRRLLALVDGRLPATQVPLVADRAELEALIALRCLQQDYAAQAAKARFIGHLVNWAGAEVDDVFADVVRRGRTDWAPGSLRRYVKLQARNIRTIENAPGWYESGGVPDGNRRPLVPSDISVSEFAVRTGVRRRQVYKLIQRGALTPVKRRPVRLQRSDVDRSDVALRKGTIYRLIQRSRGCGYDAARMWVYRRRKRGLTDKGVLEEAGFGPSNGA